MPGTAVPQFVIRIYTIDTPSDDMKSGGVLFWGELGEKSIEVFEKKLREMIYQVNNKYMLKKAK